MKKRKSYKSSIYLSTKQGKHNINIYSRYEKTKNLNDLGILRLEVQNKKRLIKEEFKKFGISKELENYWSINAMEKYFFKLIEKYCYTGDYYKIKWANKLIDESNLKNSMKKKLKQFLLDVRKYGLEGIKKNFNYNHCKINNYIQRLNSLNINPISLPDNYMINHLISLPQMTRKISKEIYFI